MKIYSNGKMLEVSGGGSSGGGAGDVYSTEEQVVGTWIDGKALYRKTVMRYSLNGDTSNWIIAYTASSDEFVLMYDPFIHSQGTDKIVFGRAYTDMSGTKVTFHFNQDTKVFQFWVTTRDFLPANIIINYYYTKTTDQATIELPTAVTAVSNALLSEKAPIMTSTAAIPDMEEV